MKTHSRVEKKKRSYLGDTRKSKRDQLWMKKVSKYRGRHRSGPENISRRE